MTYDEATRAEHMRHVHITDNPALLSDEAWAGVRKPNLVLLRESPMNLTESDESCERSD